MPQGLVGRLREEEERNVNSLRTIEGQGVGRGLGPERAERGEETVMRSSKVQWRLVKEPGDEKRRHPDRHRLHTQEADTLGGH